MEKDKPTIHITGGGKSLHEAIKNAIASGLTEEQVAVALKIGQEHAQQKVSAYDPGKVRAIPSYVEDAIAKVCGVNPPDKEIFIGRKPGPDAVIDAILDRKKIIEIALTLTDRVSEDRLKRYVDAIVNDGFAVRDIEKIAVLDVSKGTTDRVSEIFESAGVEFPTIEDAEGVASVARAILRHMMTHHKDSKTTPTGDFITPFMAWRVKEFITEGLLRTERKLVSRQGYDCTKQMDEFDATFSKTDIVLWNTDIWAAATRKSEIFADTKIDNLILDAATPMFWQFERRFDLDDYFDLSKRAYYCAGFVILPHAEEHVDVEFHRDDVEVVEKDGQPYITKIKQTPGAKEVLAKAHSDPSIRFMRHGISVSLVFLPKRGEDPPEIRYLLPIYEGDTINAKHTFIHNILAAMQFLTLEYVSKDEAKISKKELKEDRQLFKQVRKGKVQVPPIKIINLRRTARKAKDYSERDPDKPKRHYSCHWFVEPHWHKYYHKSQDRWIRHYLLTYPKGDLTKPLKPPREKIFKAVR